MPKTTDKVTAWVRAVTAWVRAEIRALSAYHVSDSADFIKLDAMENPYHWPEAMVEEWLAVLRGVSLNRYPDPVRPWACQQASRCYWAMVPMS